MPHSLYVFGLYVSVLVPMHANKYLSGNHGTVRLRVLTGMCLRDYLRMCYTSPVWIRNNLSAPFPTRDRSRGLVPAVLVLIRARDRPCMQFRALQCNKVLDSLTRLVKAWQGLAGQGRARQGRAWQVGMFKLARLGKARQGTQSIDGLTPLLLPTRRVPALHRLRFLQLVARSQR